MKPMQGSVALTQEEAHALLRRDHELQGALQQVAALDFTMIKRKLAEEYHWMPETCDDVEQLYRMFLALNVRYPERKICPTGPIDEFWHAHILDTQAYANDCQTLFGRILHHYPYFGMRGPEDRADLERTFAASIDLFISHFGVDPTAGDAQARGCSPQRCP